MYPTPLLIYPRADVSLGGPTIPAPVGSVSKLDDPPNGNHIAIPVITVCVIVSAIFYPIRFYAKYLTKKIIIADYLTVVAFPLFWVYVYYSYRLTWTSGYLVHEWDIRLKDIAAFSYVCWIATLLYLWILALVKSAILMEWMHIFVPDGRHNYFAWACYATSAAICCLCIILFIMDLVNCTPIARNWDPLIPGGVCRFDVPKFGLASATTNFTLDFIPLLLSQKVIWGLRLSRKKKLGISFIFLIGITGCVSSLVRLYFATRFYISSDTSYYFSILALCSMCETTCANLILCAPYVPKAIMGLKETQALRKLRQYMTLRNDITYINDSEVYFEAHELARAAKPKRREHWFSTTTTTTGNNTTYSEDSVMGLRPELT
ncbi:uncharacterized protein F4822DRAFT_420949 [Hypoxylon trugodes]|uniref:uncharacterized protein n=1 Tax=Hypoxylon trugodes TaxID=326681 RepID=UPI00218EA6A5|nr:uncharacterized protein F4822DRAFT_420949 [Hypoxylon trugodes]KAI1383551.1 hypothetical protein F4822DRAFT_420949 [Hypoxylon trugodes]